MELKEAILQTLAEIDANTPLESQTPKEETPKKPETKKEGDTQTPYTRKIEKLHLKNIEELKTLLEKHYLEEERFLDALQERILVLFEGLRSPKNRDIENKVEMILNFLEYVLAIIDEKKSQK